MLSGDSYVTDPKMWTCSCPAYLNSSQGLEPVKKDELDEESELINKKNILIEDVEQNDETDEKLAEALQEYKKSND
ncbi:21777_t:CDS:2 [Racocetra persica]|uniref:21777_t:CDS:1 n=1 Tax=Racocetra persica TaxID=160502 RepID=A0ACA9NMM5_9GLOM|nr:21777_t:CDS:2 [Racocetra persica]